MTTGRPERTFLVSSISKTSAPLNVGNTLASDLDAMSLSQGKETEFAFIAYSHSDAVAAVEKALSQRQRAVGAVLELSVYPGQQLFTAAAGVTTAATVPLVIEEGGIRQNALDAEQLRPFFNASALAAVRPSLLGQLSGRGYKKISEGGQMRNCGSVGGGTRTADC